MPKLNWSGDVRDKDGLVRFEHPKSGRGVWALPSATVWVEGVKIHGVDTTIEQRRGR